MSRFSDHVRGNAVAYVALFFALTGSAYALSKGEVKSKHIAKSAVKSKHVAKKAVKAKQLAPASVRSPSLADGSITGPKIAPGAVSSPKVEDGSLTGDDLDLSSLPLGLDGAQTGHPGMSPVPFNQTDPAEDLTFELSRPGRALVFAIVEGYLGTCENPDTSCYGDIGLYVNQQPVPGTALIVFRNPPNPGVLNRTVVALTPKLVGGEHLLEIRTRPGGNALSSDLSAGSRNLGAVALGGD